MSRVNHVSKDSSLRNTYKFKSSTLYASTLVIKLLKSNIKLFFEPKTRHAPGLKTRCVLTYGWLNNTMQKVNRVFAEVLE